MSLALVLLSLIGQVYLTLNVISSPQSLPGSLFPIFISRSFRSSRPRWSSGRGFRFGWYVRFGWESLRKHSSDIHNGGVVRGGINYHILLGCDEPGNGELRVYQTLYVRKQCLQQPITTTLCKSSPLC